MNGMLSGALRYLGVTATALALGFAASAAHAEKVVVGHFGSPTPQQLAAAEGRFEKATGWDIEWRKFGAGTEVIAAMASGDIKIAELGSSPLAIAASQGVELQLFMFAQVLGNAESLIVRNGSGIEKLADLKGKRVGVPVGSTAHYSLMGALKHSGMGARDLTIMNMPPDQIAAAWSQGAIDAAFVWQPVQSQIMQTGKRLVGADQIATWGYPTFDAWVVNTKFAAANADKLAAFARVMDEVNREYLKNPAAWTADSPQVKAIAARTGADPSQVPEILSGYTFVPLSEQVGSAWLGGSAAKVMKDTAEFLKEAKRIDKVAADYAPFVNVAAAQAALK